MPCCAGQAPVARLAIPQAENVLDELPAIREPGPFLRQSPESTRAKLRPGGIQSVGPQLFHQHQHG